jgi:hypothetical protein
MYWEFECNCTPTDSPLLCALEQSHKVCVVQDAYNIPTEKITQPQPIPLQYMLNKSLSGLDTATYMPLSPGNSHTSTDPSQNLAELQYSFTVYPAEVLLVSNTACYKLTTKNCSCDNYSLWVLVVRLHRGTYRRVQERGKRECYLTRQFTWVE